MYKGQKISEANCLLNNKRKYLSNSALESRAELILDMKFKPLFYYRKQNLKSVSGTQIPVKNQPILFMELWFILMFISVKEEMEK